MISEESRHKHATLLDMAIRFANRAHEGGYRRASGDRLSYINHPFAVLNRLVHWGITDEIVWSAAILHDAEEESSYYADWLGLFTDYAAHNGLKESARIVSRIVLDELTFVAGKSRWATKSDYIISFGTATIPALVIKISDRLCNSLDFYWSAKQGNLGIEVCTNYFAKGSPVFAAMENRRDSIIDRFGDVVFQNIKQDFGNVKKLLTG